MIGLIERQRKSAGIEQRIIRERSASHGNCDAAATYFQVTSRANDTCTNWECLCGGDSAGNWVRAGTNWDRAAGAARRATF